MTVLGNSCSMVSEGEKCYTADALMIYNIIYNRDRRAFLLVYIIEIDFDH